MSLRDDIPPWFTPARSWLHAIKAAHRKRYWSVDAEDVLWATVYMLGIFLLGLVVVNAVRGG